METKTFKVFSLCDTFDNPEDREPYFTILESMNGDTTNCLIYYKINDNLEKKYKKVNSILKEHGVEEDETILIEIDY